MNNMLFTILQCTLLNFFFFGFPLTVRKHNSKQIYNFSHFQTNLICKLVFNDFFTSIWLPKHSNNQLSLFLLTKQTVRLKKKGLQRCHMPI